MPLHKTRFITVHHGTNVHYINEARKMLHWNLRCFVYGHMRVHWNSMNEHEGSESIEESLFDGMLLHRGVHYPWRDDAGTHT